MAKRRMTLGRAYPEAGRAATTYRLRGGTP